MKGETFLRLFATHHSAAMSDGEAKVIIAKFELAISKLGSVEEIEDMLDRMKTELNGFTEKTRMSALIIMRHANEMISDMIRKEAELVRWKTLVESKGMKLVSLDKPFAVAIKQ